MAKTSQKAKAPVVVETDAIRFTDKEAIRVVAEEAAKTNEPLAKVAARIINRAASMRSVPVQSSIG